ncbi:MAG: DedA family protein [Candidatus Hydrogenedentes bacterium]|nr:DedA family protein [Candidatus Hydrogenedentota bacterium]
MVTLIADWITSFMSALGYPGLVIMMALESMIAPVPSEVVMPFAGFLVVEGQFTFLGAALASSLGTLLGSLLSYWMGKYGGYPLIYRYGKYFLLEREHLEYTVSWFEKRGDIAVLICRFIPVVRHLISIPAGVGKMNIVRFSVFTLLGGTIWNLILLYAGVKLGQHWDIISKYSHELDYVVVAVLCVVFAWWVRKQWKRRTAIAAEKS